MAKLRTVKIRFEVDYNLVPPSLRRHYERIERPITLHQVYGGRVRAQQGGVWTREAYANPEELAAAFFYTASQWRSSAYTAERDHGAGDATQGIVDYWHDKADFMRAAGLAALHDPRIARLWP